MGFFFDEALTRENVWQNADDMGMARGVPGDARVIKRVVEAYKNKNNIIKVLTTENDSDIIIRVRSFAASDSSWRPLCVTRNEWG